LHGRGSSHVGGFTNQPNVQVTYLIDPDTRTYASRLRQAQPNGGNNPPRTLQDVRRALEDKNLDAISIATPNHWHSLMSIWACQAGKDVYVEKPLSHNVHEGRVLATAAARNNRIVQHGTQSRSDMNWARVVEVIRSGQLGRLLVARGLCYKTRNSIGTRPNTPAPNEMDFNLWVGPAQETAHHANLVHYNWHWFWEFGNGDIGNQGVHQMDIARWGIPGATWPRSVISLGGRFGYEDQGQTPNTQMAVFDYGQTQLIFEVRGLRTERYHGQTVGNIFHMEGGTIVGNRFLPNGRTESVPLPAVNATRGPGGSNHFANFIAAMRSRRTTDLNAPALEGHYSSGLGHLANISYRLGEQVAFNPRTRAFANNEAATETLARLEDHLSQTNNLRLQDLTCRVGPRLTFNAQEERFTGAGADRANPLLTRNYRQGFTLPNVG
jgi:predicted dehydrogenase